MRKVELKTVTKGPASQKWLFPLSNSMTTTSRQRRPPCSTMATQSRWSQSLLSRALFMNFKFDEHIATIAKVTHQVALPKLSTNGFHKKKFILLSIRFSHLRILIILHRPSVTPRLSGGGLKHKYRQESRLEISFGVIEGGKVSFCMLTCFNFWHTPV